MVNVSSKILTLLRKPRLLVSSYNAKCEERFKLLKQGFDNFCILEDQNSINLAKKLVRQEGEIDQKVENLKNSQKQRDLSIKFHWGHNHNFGNGFSVKGKMGDRHIDLISQFMVGFGLQPDFLKTKIVLM